MEIVHLQGAEEVQRAANQMTQAAAEMRSAAGTIDESLTRLERFMNEWIERLESVLSLSKATSSDRAIEFAASEHARFAVQSLERLIPDSSTHPMYIDAEWQQEAYKLARTIALALLESIKITADSKGLVLCNQIVAEITKTRVGASPPLDPMPLFFVDFSGPYNIVLAASARSPVRLSTGAIYNVGRGA